MNSFVRYGGGVCAVLGLVLLAGCEPKEGAVAEINNETILEHDYNTRVQAVTAVPENMNLDAGGMTIVNMIRDRLTRQLAVKRNALPSEEMIKAAADYQVRTDPATNQALGAGKMNMEDLIRQKRFELEAFGIGTNGDKPSETDMDKTYDEFKTKPDFHIKGNYTVRLLSVPDDATGKLVIADLKRTADFKGVSQKYLHVSALDAMNAGKEQILLGDQLRPELKAALDKLAPNDITPEPVAVKLENPSQPLQSQIVYAVAQLKSKEPERTLSRQEVSFLLKMMVLQKTHPGWREHYRRELADFTKTSQIRIAIQKYAGLVDTFVRPVASAEAGGHPATVTAPGQ